MRLFEKATMVIRSSKRTIPGRHCLTGYLLCSLQIILTRRLRIDRRVDVHGEFFPRVGQEQAG